MPETKDSSEVQKLKEIVFCYEEACKYLKLIGFSQNGDVWTTPDKSKDIRVPPNKKDYASTVTRALDLLGKEHWKVLAAIAMLYPVEYKAAITHPFCNK